ncbi:hypothetical protein PCANC_23699 [Puccinia coronata f. sp. avenae]|uniref:Uncharacterized protein n=1 Tax=Puccinia coronata f. sp. avenae TaxID=200324 RepID=A0A2N5UDE5_9BASI|nr:hypothetical protein PCANC_23699 [Puccinia coronata f. sp. avenae]
MSPSFSTRTKRYRSSILQCPRTRPRATAAQKDPNFLLLSALSQKRKYQPSLLTHSPVLHKGSPPLIDIDLPLPPSPNSHPGRSMSHTGPPSMPSFGFLPSVAPSLSHGTHSAPQGSGWPAGASQGQHHHGYYNGALNDYNGAINDQDANTYLGDPMSQLQHDRYCNGALPLQDTSIGLSLAIDQQGPLPHGSTLRNQVLQPGNYQLYPQHFNYFGGNAPPSGQPPAQHVPSAASAPAPGFTQYPPPSRPEPVPCSQPPAPLQVANP